MQDILKLEETCCAPAVKFAKNGRISKGKRTELHPDHSPQLARLNRVIGQLEGVKRMIVERRYCPEILVQTRALSSALRTIELGILESHIRNCVSQALSSKDQKRANSKVGELISVLERFQ